MNRKKINRRERKTIIQYIVLVILALLFFVPLLWLLLASINPNANPTITMPKQFSLGNFAQIFTNPDNLRGFLNSFIIAGVTSVTVVVLALLASYPLSRYELRGKGKFLYAIIFMTSLPVNAILVPVFRMFIKLGLQDNLLSIALFMAATNMPYGIWMTKNFMDAVPVSLEEAARVDGANSIQVLKNVIIPLMKPGILTVLIYVFTGAWGNFFTPFILLQSTQKYPAAVRIYQYFNDGGIIEYGKLAAYSVVYMLPCIMLYAFAQKFMSQGFALSGGDKG